MQPVIRFVLILLAGFPLWGTAQRIPYLEKKVSLNARNLSLADVLNTIEKQTGVVFSYSPKQVNDQKKITVKYIKTPLRLIMDDLVRITGYRYKSRSNYIILYSEAKKTDEPPAISYLSGYVYNSRDGTVLENASVYIPSGKHSAVSDEYGFFFISCSKTKNSVQLTVAKENFHDTVFVIPEPSIESVKLFLSPEAISPALPTTENPPVDSTTPSVFDSVYTQPVTDPVSPPVEKRLSRWSNLNKMKVNLKNIKDTFLNNFSFSLVPPISTNKLLSFNTVNKFSLNLIAGYSKGVELLEIGGLVNVDDGDVSYFQVGGLGNAVSGSAKGAQVGGLYTITKKNVSGAQVGGLYASCGQKVSGAQIGGLFSKADTVHGMQVGGLYGYTRHQNLGAQIGGLFAHADSIKGFQLGGLFTHAHYLSGAQISGLFNYARTMHGFQFSFINIARDVKGIPFGFFSYVHNGYHKIEISVNELQMVNLGFRSGVNHLHNIFFAGIGWNGANRTWTYGYGLGATFQLGKKWGITTDLSTQQINLVGGTQNAVDLVNKLLVAAEFSPAKKLHVSVGPTYNVRVADTRHSGYATITDSGLVRYMYDRDENGSFMNTKMWVGASISVKFL